MTAEGGDPGGTGREDFPPIPFTQRYVVPADGRRRLAWASVRFTLLSSRAQRVFYATIVVFALALQTFEGWTPADESVLEACGFVAVGLALSVVWASTVGFLQTYHSTRYRFYPDAVLESGFGDDAFVLRGPAGDTWLPYGAVRRARVRGEFVFFSTDGIGGQAIFPKALFPDAQVERITAG
ncbi:hypothetical protein [Nocardioides sp.]|uniref:hypothetical protein n=1 Tax=Nocardioides sp. TaxID=35761 RepID=UPI002726D792|nr:hypothetical protein [Nocardioides sp.]MDO9454890.1 hypothetical protein [Nocardioides sp.]